MRVHGHRPWILITAIFVALLLFFGNRWYRSPEVQSSIRSAVEETVSNLIGGEAEIDSLEIGLLSVTVSGLDLTIPLNAIELSVDKIQIGFSLAALLKREWEPQELVDRLTVIHPVISITPVQSSQTQDIEPQPIEKLIPFRKASMKDCSISLLRRKDMPLITVKGLDGEILKNGGTAQLSLNGAVGSLLDNFSLNATLSDSVEEQRISLRLKDVDLKDLIKESELDIQGTVNGSIESFFHDGVFPRNIEPDGWLNLNDFTLRNNSSTLIDQGMVELLFEEGRIFTQSCSAQIPGGVIEGAVNLLVDDSLSGKISLSANLDSTASSLPPVTDISGTLAATVTIIGNQPDNQPITISGNLFQKENHFTLAGGGALVPEGILLSQLKGTTPYGVINTTLAFQDGVLQTLGVADLKYTLTPEIAVRGSIPFQIEYETDKGTPSIALNTQNLIFHSGKRQFPVPDLTVETVRKSLLLRGKNSSISLSAHVEDLLKPMDLYRADIELSTSALPDIARFFEADSIIDSGTVSIQINGVNGTSSIQAQTTLFTPWGSIALDGGGITNHNKTSIQVTKGIATYDSTAIEFIASLNSTRRGWNLNLNTTDSLFTVTSQFSKDFSNISKLTGKLDTVQLINLNQFIPLKESVIRSGILAGEITASGPVDSPEFNLTAQIDKATIGSLDALHGAISLNYKNNRVRIAPISLMRHRQELIRTDTIYLGDTTAFDMEISRLSVGRALSYMDGDPISATLSAMISGDSSGLRFFGSLPSFTRGELTLDSIAFEGSLRDQKLILDTCSFRHYNSKGSLALSVPINEDSKDTLSFDFRLEGDLLASAGEFVESPVGGSGNGTIRLKGVMADGELQIEQARLLIPEGDMTVYPYVRGSVRPFFADIKGTSSDSISINIRGEIGRRQVVIKNDYNSVLKPMKFGSVNLGVIRIYTEEGGVPLFVPGFLENRKGNVGFIEVAGKDSIPAFTLSGTPPDDFLVTGTLLLRKAEITFPLLEDVEWPSDFDPFPLVGFDLDIQPADRSVTYFYRVGDIKKRRSIRLVEATLDPSRTIGVRGRDQDGDFRVTGEIRSYKGFLFYGKMFDQNFELGLDFSSGKTEGELHDNLPIIWGSAQTFADTNRYDKTEVYLMTRDPEDGTLHRRGRLTELVVVPATGVTEDGNIDEEAAEFYKQTGREMLDLNEAGNTISSIGDRYVNSFVLNYWGRQVARHMGLDMIRVESSMMSNTFNYLYQAQLDSTLGFNIGHMALANTGITLGKYVAGDQLLLKMRTQFSTLDTLLIPEYKLGLEYQPLRYLWMDFNYGIKHDYLSNSVQMNPEVRLQLRMPFSKIQQVFQDN